MKEEKMPIAIRSHKTMSGIGSVIAIKTITESEAMRICSENNVKKDKGAWLTWELCSESAKKAARIYALRTTHNMMIGQRGRSPILTPQKSLCEHSG